MIALGPCAEDELARRVEGAGEDERRRLDRDAEAGEALRPALLHSGDVLQTDAVRAGDARLELNPAAQPAQL